MTKLEFTISTLTSLLLGLMLIMEVVLSNLVAYNQGVLNHHLQTVNAGSNAYRMWQAVASDCSQVANDPDMGELLIRQDIQPGKNVPPFPSPITPSH